LAGDLVMAELVGTLASVVQLIAAGTIVGVLLVVINVAKMEAVAVESNVAGSVAAYSRLISQAQRLTSTRKLTMVGVANQSHDNGDGNGDDRAKDDGGIVARHGERI
jgi:hypothetical protein